MNYEPEKSAPEESNRRRWPFWRKTLQIPGDEIRHFEYADDTDRKGKVSRIEKIEAGAAR